MWTDDRIPAPPPTPHPFLPSSGIKRCLTSWGFRGDINVEWNKLRDSEFMCHDLLNVEIINKRKMESLTDNLIIEVLCYLFWYFNEIYFTIFNERRYFSSTFYFSFQYLNSFYNRTELYFSVFLVILRFYKHVKF